MKISALRTAVFSLAAACIVASASAQPVPYGWVVAKNKTEWVATSPDQGRGLTVQLVYKAVTPPVGALDFWFPEALQRAAMPYGEVVSIAKPDTLEQDGSPRLVAAAAVVKVAMGRTSVLGYGYDTPKGRQLILIILPTTLGRKNPAYNAAFDRMSDFWSDGAVYDPVVALAPPPPLKPATPAPAKPAAKPAAKPKPKPKPKTP